ncbi:hypothetical protein QE152_g36519 [Popillia japonica]|uniref:Uncharacterized protein n=1 Tax=Popillia japonica TaxID=7064 RepID=A0AAW1IDB2_POPJA
MSFFLETPTTSQRETVTPPAPQILEDDELIAGLLNTFHRGVAAGAAKANTSPPGAKANTSSPDAKANTSSPGAKANTSSPGTRTNTASPPPTVDQLAEALRMLTQVTLPPRPEPPRPFGGTLSEDPLVYLARLEAHTKGRTIHTPEDVDDLVRPYLTGEATTSSLCQQAASTLPAIRPRLGGGRIGKPHRGTDDGPVLFRHRPSQSQDHGRPRGPLREVDGPLREKEACSQTVWSSRTSGTSQDSRTHQINWNRKANHPDHPDRQSSGRTLTKMLVLPGIPSQPRLSAAASWVPRPPTKHRRPRRGKSKRPLHGKHGNGPHYHSSTNPDSHHPSSSRRPGGPRTNREVLAQIDSAASQNLVKPGWTSGTTSKVIVSRLRADIILVTSQTESCQVRNTLNRGAHQSPIPPTPDPGKTYQPPPPSPRPAPARPKTTWKCIGTHSV